MFASIIVVLPSQFTGGDAHLSHGGTNKIFDTSGPSLTQTTVMSWYTDVMHEIKPITGGYRFALSYNLVHTTTALRPALSINTSAVEKLRYILLSWKQDDSGPEKIIYLLDHQYSQANLSGSALKGEDAHMMASLESLGRELGFQLGLANLVHNVTGDPDEDDDPYGGDVSMGEIQDRTMSIKHLVDVDGRLIREHLDFDEESETIPADLAEKIEGGDPDDEEYEGYQGNVGCSKYHTECTCLPFGSALLVCGIR